MFDSNKDGFLNLQELGRVYDALGLDLTEDVKKKYKDSRINFDQFVQFMTN